jgi:hypothetical protein
MLSFRVLRFQGRGLEVSRFEIVGFQGYEVSKFLRTTFSDFKVLVL